MAENGERDPFARVLHDADTLHAVAMQGAPQDLAKAARRIARALSKRVDAHPLIALAIAGALGIFAGSVISSRDRWRLLASALCNFHKG